MDYQTERIESACGKETIVERAKETEVDRNDEKPNTKCKKHGAEEKEENENETKQRTSSQRQKISEKEIERWMDGRAWTKVYTKSMQFGRDNATHALEIMRN